MSATIVYGMSNAESAYEIGDYERALRILERLEEMDSTTAAPAFLRGLIYTALYRFDDSDREFSRVLEEDSLYIGAWYRIGQNAFLQNAYGRALSAYGNELRLIRRGGITRAERPDAATLYAQMGRAYAHRNTLDSARIAYEQAVKLHPKNLYAWSWLGDLLRKEGEYAEALEAAERAFAIDSTHVETRYLLGALLTRIGEAGRAVPHLERVLEDQPWHEGATYNLGQALMADGRPDEAAPYLALTDSLRQLEIDIEGARKAAHAFPDQLGRWQRLRELLVTAGRYDDAREAYAIEQYIKRRQ